MDNGQTDRMIMSTFFVLKSLFSVIHKSPEGNEIFVWHICHTSSIQHTHTTELRKHISHFQNEKWHSICFIHFPISPIVHRKRQFFFAMNPFYCCSSSLRMRIVNKCAVCWSWNINWNACELWMVFIRKGTTCTEIVWHNNIFPDISEQINETLNKRAKEDKGKKHER